MTLFSSMFRQCLKAFFLCLAALTAIYLVIDFADRAKGYTGEGWVMGVLELYFYKGLLAAYQLSPAALLLAGGVTLSALRQHGELTAMKALGMGPRTFFVPLVATAFVVVFALVGFDELFLGQAGLRVDDLTINRFHQYSDFRAFFSQKQWFRGRDRIYVLRAGSPEQGFSNVSIFQLTPEFRLAERIDAERLEPLEGKRWRLRRGIIRRFDGRGASSVETFDGREIELPEDASSFRLRIGRPEELRFLDLREQIRRRQKVGQPTATYRMALHNKLAYPLTGLPACLLAGVAALRPGRRGHLTAALTEGFAIALALWAVTVLARSAAGAGHFSAGAAAWTPLAVLLVLSLALARKVR